MRFSAATRVVNACEKACLNILTGHDVLAFDSAEVAQALPEGFIGRTGPVLGNLHQEGAAHVDIHRGPMPSLSQRTDRYVFGRPV